MTRLPLRVDGAHVFCRSDGLRHVAHEKAAVALGTSVKLMLEMKDWGERMWVTVIEVKKRHLIGVLDNDPWGIPRLAPGDRIKFKRDHIIDHSECHGREGRETGSALSPAEATGSEASVDAGSGRGRLSEGERSRGGSTMVRVSAERDELRRLVENLPEEEVPAAVAELRLRTAPAADRAWPPLWFGAASAGRTDVAARSEEMLEDGFGRSA